MTTASNGLLKRVGIFCLPVAPPNDTPLARKVLQALLRDIETAEANGLGFAWIAEHHTVAYGGCVPNPLALIAAAGQQVSKITLASCMTLAPLRHSRLIAQEAQLVSRLIQGPFHLGLGRGFLPGDVQDFGLSHADATSKFWATVEDLAALRSDQQWVQDIWVATTSPEGAATAGRLGLGLALNPYTRTEAEINTSISLYRDHIARSGLSHMYRVLIHEPLYLDETIADAARIGSSNFAHYLSALKNAENSTGTKTTENHHTLGNQDYASRCAFLDEASFSNRLISWQNRGVTHWCFLVRFGNLTDASVAETIMRCARSAASAQAFN